MVPGSPLAIGMGSNPVPQLAVWASAPFPAKDDGSVALGFMVSLEDRRAGHFTWDLAASPQRDGRPEHRPTAHQTSPALPAPAQCVSRLIMGLYTLDLVFLLHLSGGFHRFLSLMRLLPRNLNEQIYMPFSEVFNLKAVYSYLFIYLNYGTD